VDTYGHQTWTDQCPMDLTTMRTGIPSTAALSLATPLAALSPAAPVAAAPRHQPLRCGRSVHRRFAPLLLLLLTAEQPTVDPRRLAACPLLLLWLAEPRQDSPGQALASQRKGGRRWHQDGSSTRGPGPARTTKTGRRWRSVSATSGGRSSAASGRSRPPPCRYEMVVAAWSCCCPRPA
jgi:hypothetical protein